MAPPKKPWFRFYVEACGDRKLRRLKPEHRWLFVACMAAARQSPEPGVLLVGNKPMDCDDLADFAGMTRRQVRDGMAALSQEDTAMVAYDESSGAWWLPRFAERQYESDSSTKRTRRLRERRCDGDGTADGTAIGRQRNGPETEDREQRTELSSSSSVATDAAPRPDDDDFLDSVCQSLAGHDLARLQTDRPDHHVGDIDRWLASAARRRRTQDGAALAATAAAHPDWTPEQVAEHHLTPSTQHPLDAAAEAARERMTVAARRHAGAVACAACEDRGVVELDDGTCVDCTCKAKPRPSLRAVPEIGATA